MPLGSRTIPAPGQWTIENGVVSSVSADVTFPDWIDQEPVEQRSEQMFGAPAVEAALDPTRPVEEQLLELYREQPPPRGEVARRAEQRLRRACSCRLSRRSAIRIRSRPGRCTSTRCGRRWRWAPSRPSKIYQTLVDQRGEAAADDLYQMLCGYGPEQIGTPDEFRQRSGDAAGRLDGGRQPRLPRAGGAGHGRDHRHAADAQPGRHAHRARPRHPPLAAADQGRRSHAASAVSRQC